MKKTNFYYLLCVMIMMSTTVEVKSMFRFIFVKKVLSASPYIAFMAIISKIGANVYQLDRIQKLKHRCRLSEKSTSTAWEKERAETMSHSSRMPRTFFSKEILIQCMKNKDENLKNYFYCEDLLENAQDLVEKIYAEKGN